MRCVLVACLEDAQRLGELAFAKGLLAKGQRGILTPTMKD